MKKIFFIIVVTILAKVSSSQQPTILKLAPLSTITTPVADFTTDNLGNIYLLTATNQIKKISEKGDSIGVYNDVKRYGKIYSIDATNPLKILVYYRDFSTIIILDRLLSVQATVDLRKQNISQARAITSSYDNNIWVFDEMESKLKKVDETGRILFESTDLRQVFDQVPVPQSLQDRDGQLYLYDSSKGLLVFDYYGARRNNLQLLHLTNLQVIDKNTITATDRTHIFLYKPATLQLLSYKAFEDQTVFKKISFNGSFLYCLSNDGELKIFKVLNQ